MRRILSLISLLLAASFITACGEDDEQTTTVGTGDTSDNVNDGFTRVDLSLRQRLGAGASLLVNVNNLTGVDESASLVNRVVDVTRLRNGELYGTTVDFGLRVDL